MEQLGCVSKAMAYIHKSAERTMARLHCHQAVQHKFFSPLTFQEFHHLFKTIAHQIEYRSKVSSSALKNLQ